MFRIPRRRPSAALIVACCALFVALGGTSYAVATGTIGSQEIRDGSIKDVDIANRALRGEKLVLDGIGGNAVKEEALDASKLGTVRRATAADTAARATTADTAAHATAADTATRASTVDYATRAGTAESARSADTAVRADSATTAETADTVAGLQLQVVVSGDGGRSYAHGVTAVDKLATGYYLVTFDRDVTRCVAVATVVIQFHLGDPPTSASTGQVAVQLWGPLGNDTQRRQVWVHTADRAGDWADRDFHLLVSC